MFLKHFNRASWEDLSSAERSTHRYLYCTACVKQPNIDVYAYFRRNSQIMWHNFQKGANSEQISTILQANYQNMQLTATKLTTQAAAKTPLPPTAKQLIAMDKRSQAAVQLEKTSHRADSKVANPEVRRKPEAKPYSVKHERFDFGRFEVLQKMRTCLDSGSKINWLRLAREHPVVREDGMVTKASYGAQVIKAYAISMGLVKKSEKRRVRRNKTDVRNAESSKDVAVELPQDIVLEVIKVEADIGEDSSK